ncbi:hypothetical protein F2P81_008710 [Scophthalmus maximus]|uniref:Coiled-coil alpha-helical rod protein 1 n=1 Tax=Scophthalmus maximus TaxID=52904 RepID=A0A6A4SSQ3_SCOMX|nr:hypothetical protein F2P81_008710 [Scophthalmus maximus]
MVLCVKDPPGLGIKHPDLYAYLLLRTDRVLCAFTTPRQSLELDANREELCKAKTELSQIRGELFQSNAQKEKISSQLERLKSESDEEIARLSRDVERRKEEAWELALKAEMGRSQAEEEAKQQTLRLSEHLEEMQRKQEVEFGSLEQQLQQEQHRASVLQHCLDDRIAELDMERVEKETMKQDLAQAHKANSRLKSESQKSQAELQLLTEAVHSLTNLKTELSLGCEERDKLTRELKRTPELIEKALADLKEQYESKRRQQQQELEQSWEEVRQAAVGREEAEQSLQHIQAQLEESKVNLEKLRSELLTQQEHGEQALQQSVSEIEDRCAEKLRELEVQVNTARREHTKAGNDNRNLQRGAALCELESNYLQTVTLCPRRFLHRNIGDIKEKYDLDSLKPSEDGWGVTVIS